MSGETVELPLNGFQRVMRLFDERQPFQGIDAIEAHDAVRIDDLERAVNDELNLLGIGWPMATRHDRSVIYRPSQGTVRVEVCPSRPLEEQFAAELNLRFQPADPLIRVWVLPSQPRSHIGMTWQHYPIDGVSGADLFRRILSRYLGTPLAVSSTATERFLPNLAVEFQKYKTLRWKLRDLVETIEELYRISKVYPISRPKPEGTLLQVQLLELPHPPRPAGATTNDLIAAAVLASLAEVLPERERRHWQRGVNLMNFVDLRPFGGEPLRRAWGLFLGFCVFHLPDPQPADFAACVESIRKQSMRIKDEQLFFGSVDAFTAYRMAWPWIPRRWSWTLPGKLLPFSAALTNTRHRKEWSSGALGAAFGRSWRVAPLGNMVSLGVDVCTKGNQLSIALTTEAPSTMHAKMADFLPRFVAKLRTNPV